MRFSITKNGRTSKSSQASEWHHPDLPLSSQPLAPTPRPQHTLNRSTSISDRFSSAYSGDRRSIAVFPPSAEQGAGVYEFDTPDDVGQPPPPQLLGGLSRSQTVLRRDGAGSSRTTSPPSPAADWSPDFAHLPPHSETHEFFDDEASMSIAPGKTSSESGHTPGTDRWSQRRLQRLNTEQGFREQRQGGQGILSPPLVSELGSYNPSAAQYPAQQSQPQPSLHQPSQPHPPQPAAYQGSRTAPAGHGLTVQTHPAHVPAQQYSPPASAQPYQSQDPSRPPITQTRSYSSQHQSIAEDAAMTSSNGNIPPPKAASVRAGGNNRQSVHNGLSSREGPSAQGMLAYNAAAAPPGVQGRQQQEGPIRMTPQPLQTAGGDEMGEDDVAQLVKDHKELREKYTKVKKYYFEKEDQVKQLQNSLAHQRLSQSRTSLDDSEYTTRFNRLDGLIAQLAFSVRKNWKSMPDWLDKSVNKDAVSIGKQEMTAAGRSFISKWLVDEVFNKYFHPDLEPSLSAQLKAIQLNIRRFAPPTQTVEEEEYLTSKVINWRLSTLEGLQDALRSPQCPGNRTQLTDMLKDQLIKTLAVHLQDPPPSDLEGGVHMIIELVVSILIHLPVESRDVVIEYFAPGFSIMPEHMKVESGIPPLQVSIADDHAERASMKSAASDMTDMTENNRTGKSNKSSQGKHAAAGNSNSSLQRPESVQGQREDQPPRVRMAAGIGVQIRNRTVLVKAPIFST